MNDICNYFHTFLNKSSSNVCSGGAVDEPVHSLAHWRPSLASDVAMGGCCCGLGGSMLEDDDDGDE